VSHDATHDARTAIERARSAQGPWAALPLHARIKKLRAWRDAFIKRRDDVIDIAMREGGKLRFEAVSLELAPAILNLAFVSRYAEDALGDQRIKRFLPLPRKATRLFDPHGVCALIAPFNYTLSIPMATLAPALVAGNAVVWKPGEPGAQMARLAVDLLQDAGIDPRLVQIVEGGAQAGRALVDAQPDHVTFIGSTVAGRKVAARCGELLIPSILELGGNAAALVLEDADLDRAARAIVFGRLANRGASCVAVERVFVVDTIFDELWARVHALMTALEDRTSTPRAPGLEEKDRAIVEDARERGARVVGERHVLIDATEHDDVRALHEEVFGPVLPFVRVKDADDAIVRSNHAALQLSAYVFTRDAEEGRRIARALRAPHVVLNDVMIHYAMMELPFGGRGASGSGRVHGLEGIRAYAVDRTLVEGHLPLAKEPWWMPYEDKLLEQALRALPTAVRVWDKLK
jgi:acyl-CoA reductase-like NAD-dependent aldehyde dehydrogenase